MNKPSKPAGLPGRVSRKDAGWVRYLLITLVLAFFGVMVVVPLINVFAQAFSHGWAVVQATLSHSDTLAALRLTITVTVLAVAANLAFGLAAAWAIARFRFRGKALLTSMI